MASTNTNLQPGADTGLCRTVCDTHHRLVMSIRALPQGHAVSPRLKYYKCHWQVGGGGTVCYTFCIAPPELKAVPLPLQLIPPWCLLRLEHLGLTLRTSEAAIILLLVVFLSSLASHLTSNFLKQKSQRRSSYKQKLIFSYVIGGGLFLAMSGVWTYKMKQRICEITSRLILMLEI